jgi:CRP-like cAMP-binding protein
MNPEHERFSFADHPFLGRLSESTAAELKRRMEPRAYGHGEVIVAEGDATAGVFLIMSGRVRSSVMNAAGVDRTVGLHSAGSCFGELYVVTGSPHPVSMTAEGPVEARELTREAYADLSDGDPELRAAVLELFIFAVHDGVDRTLRTLARGRMAPTG